MSRSTQRMILIPMTIGVWTAVAIVASTKFKLAARSPLTLSIGVRPQPVKVLVDGERHGDGAYVETPLKLPLAPGRHKLKISRDGYVAHRITVDVEAGENLRMDDIVLERQSGTQFYGVDVTGDVPLYADVDNGLGHGELPLSLPEITADQPHILTLFPKWPERDGRWSCRFTPTASSTTSGGVHHIKVRQKAGKFRVSNCERMAQKHR